MNVDVKKSIEFLKQKIHEGAEWFKKKYREMSEKFMAEYRQVNNAIVSRYRIARDKAYSAYKNMRKQLDKGLKKLKPIVDQAGIKLKSVFNRVASESAKSFKGIMKSVSSVIRKGVSSLVPKKTISKTSGPAGNNTRDVSGSEGGDKFLGQAKLALTAIKAVIAGIIKVGKIAAKFETIKLSLEFITGSANKAGMALKGMLNFAGKSPFSNDEVIEAGKVLLKYGYDASSAKETLNLLGDSAKGSGTSLAALANIYGQISMQGAASLSNLEELTRNNIPVVEALAGMYGKTCGEIKRMAERGEITAEDIKKAFGQMSSSGGEFHDAMDKTNKSFDGIFDNLSDALENAGKTIGEMFLPGLKLCAEYATSLVNWLTDSAKLIKDFLTLGGGFWQGTRGY